jgi:HEPN domain-containing protein
MARFACRPDERMFGQSCFHSQQCVEKCLKAMLVRHGLPVPRTHNLGHLLTSLLACSPALASWATDADWLTQFAVDARYPSRAPLATNAEHAARALGIAERARDFCRECLAAGSA